MATPTEDEMWDFVMRGQFPVMDPIAIRAMKSEWRWGFAYGVLSAAMAAALYINLWLALR